MDTLWETCSSSLEKVKITFSNAFLTWCPYITLSNFTYVQFWSLLSLIWSLFCCRARRGEFKHSKAIKRRKRRIVLTLRKGSIRMDRPWKFGPIIIFSSLSDSLDVPFSKEWQKVIVLDPLPSSFCLPRPFLLRPPSLLSLVSCLYHQLLSFLIEHKFISLILT